MIYACCNCQKMFEHTDFESKTKQKVDSRYFIPFGAIGWLSATYICPNPRCNHDNAGYELKTEEEARGIKLFEVSWHGGRKEQLKGYDIKHAFVRAGYDVAELLNVKVFKELEMIK